MGDKGIAAGERAEVEMAPEETLSKIWRAAASLCCTTWGSLQVAQRRWEAAKCVDRRAARGPPPSPPLRACEHLPRLRAPIGGPIVPGLAWFLIPGACLQADVEVRHPRCRAALALEGQNAKVKKLPTRSSPIRWVARLRWSSRHPSPLAARDQRSRVRSPAAL